MDTGLGLEDAQEVATTVGVSIVEAIAAVVLQVFVCLVDKIHVQPHLLFEPHINSM